MRIFLNGFMGSGKSYWGKLWAEESAMDYYDLDGIIEKDEGMTVDQIFENKGESFFRKKEFDALRSLAAKDNCIISCGGGTPCFDDNMKWMNENGICIYLQASPVKLLDNIILEIDKRPLLKKINKSEMLFFIEQKLKERLPFYQQAQMQFSVSDLSIQTIKEIIQQC